MSKQTIYLCGPMELVTVEEGQGWRQKVVDELSDMYKILNPYDWSNQFKHPDTGEIHNPEGMVNMDLWAVRTSDILIVNVDNRGFGTPIELHYAYNLGKGTYVYGKHSTHPFISYFTSHPFESLDDIIKTLKG